MQFSQEFHHRPIARQRPKRGLAADMEFGMRFIAKILASLIILLLMAVTIAFILLHTRHSALLVNTLVSHLSDTTLQVTEVQYSLQDDPRHLRLIQPRWQRQGYSEQTAERIDLWLSPTSLFRKGWHFDSLLIQGLTLNHLSDLPLESGTISTQRLALTNLTLDLPELQLKNARLQIDNWRNSEAHWGDFSGNFQLSADQLIWQQQTLNKLLIDGEHSSKGWTFYGVSFHWLNANFNGQAEFEADTHHLIVHQLTANGLQIDENFPLEPLLSLASEARQTDLSLELRRLDILDGSLERSQYSVNHASLSLENWQWPGALWQQKDARLSLGAETLRWHDLMLENPLTELHLTPGQISLKGFSARLLEGYVRTEATLTPDALLLHQLELKGIRWVMPEAIQAWLMGNAAPQSPLQQQVDTWWRQLNELTVDQLSVGYSQLTGTYAPLPIQFSDINLEGTGMVLLHEGQPGLWQGEFAAGAGFTNIRQITIRNPLLTMSSQAGHWQLTRLTLPIEAGILEGKGEIQLGEAGWPWQLKLSGDSLPPQMLSHWLNLPLPLLGAMDIQTQASGLGQFQRGLAYSLHGQLEANFRQLSLTQQESALMARWQATEQPTGFASSPDSTEPLMPVTLSPLTIHADRGRISLEPLALQGPQLHAELQGAWDLAAPADSAVELQASDGCQQLTKRWHSHQQETSVSSSCERKSI
ncbi:AsmA family protein [Photobacterium galatheae]|uniref:AsmA domain-containing protein n=1 Tax=Photobacterium galatheae TaxID=1654360 RepID=A0A066RWW3_9GAMM|nr:AsmA family protein [Photobacterium galatheae]KDM92152.1 hypothetical protein EA58_07980 [Photobacterium galatheae]MCM0150999.1 AsmA family protein [Photobacterium galatheae]